MKFCKDCKHYLKTITDTGYVRHNCVHPKIRDAFASRHEVKMKDQFMITGESPSMTFALPLCSQGRLKSYCGEEARWFE